MSMENWKPNHWIAQKKKEKRSQKDNKPIKKHKNQFNLNSGHDCYDIWVCSEPLIMRTIIWSTWNDKSYVNRCPPGLWFLVFVRAATLLRTTNQPHAVFTRKWWRCTRFHISRETHHKKNNRPRNNEASSHNNHPLNSNNPHKTQTHQSLRLHQSEYSTHTHIYDTPHWWPTHESSSYYLFRRTWSSASAHICWHKKKHTPKYVCRSAPWRLCVGIAPHRDAGAARETRQDYYERWLWRRANPKCWLIAGFFFLALRMCDKNVLLGQPQLYVAKVRPFAPVGRPRKEILLHSLVFIFCISTTSMKNRTLIWVV